MEMCRTAVDTRAPGISHSPNMFFFPKYLKVLVSVGRISIQLSQR